MEILLSDGALQSATIKYQHHSALTQATTASIKVYCICDTLPLFLTLLISIVNIWLYCFFSKSQLQFVPITYLYLMFFPEMIKVLYCDHT